MEYCQALGLEPRLTFIIEYNHGEDSNYKDNISNALPIEKCEVSLVPIFKCNGTPLPKMLLSFPREFIREVPENLNIDGNSYPLVNEASQHSWGNKFSSPDTSSSSTSKNLIHMVVSKKSTSRGGSPGVEKSQGLLYDIFYS